MAPEIYFKKTTQCEKLSALLKAHKISLFPQNNLRQSSPKYCASLPFTLGRLPLNGLLLADQTICF